jgi:SagB-type dehydrogenase family enzyme
MSRTRTPRKLEEVGARERFPVSALFHESTKLTDRRLLDFKERIDAASGDPPPRKVYASRPRIELARSRRALFGGPRLDDVLRTRRSPRGAFRGAALRVETLGSLLDLSLGSTGDGLRAWPSAGALYPLEAYVASLACDGLPPALHHYDPGRHALSTIAECPPRDALARVIVARGADVERWDHAAAALIFTAVFERTQSKYGERGYRFVHLEAGHAAQNVLLVATALGISALPLGGFCEDAVGEMLGLDPAIESPVYVVLLGT